MWDKFLKIAQTGSLHLLTSQAANWNPWRSCTFKGMTQLVPLLCQDSKFKVSSCRSRQHTIKKLRCVNSTQSYNGLLVHILNIKMQTFLSIQCFTNRLADQKTSATDELMLSAFVIPSVFISLKQNLVGYFSRKIKISEVYTQSCSRIKILQRKL